MRKKRIDISVFVIALILLVSALPYHVQAQFKYKWMNVGSLHNWYSEVGCEVEEGRSSAAHQQDGLQWPALFPYQDSQAAKAMWVGAKNFTDERGGLYTYKVAHIGPRVTGQGEFYPVEFKMVSRFDAPRIFVDGLLSFEKNVEIDEIDPDIPCDRMIVNTSNSLLGVTMTRKIMQFSIPNNDNYMVYDYVYTNTGNIDDDEEIELPGQTLTDFYIFFQYRLASCFNTRYAIANGTGWGMNTMIDFRGDGTENPATYGDPPDENFRAGFVWHGYFPDRDDKSYDNIGGPIWNPASYVADYDTVGRLGAPQFVGLLTIYADKSPTEKIDDASQPSTTGWYGSDLPETSGNDPYNVKKMEREYGWMSYGNMIPRHAWAVEPSGDFAAQKTGPNLDLSPPMAGKPGGFSIGNGYGPYTLGPGESIHLIMAEAVNGLSTEKCIEIGKQYKNGEIDAYTKNTLVLTGKDSLFKTFRNAIANYESGYDLPKPPKPVKLFSIDGGGDRISLSWQLYDDPGDIASIKIYRNAGEYNNPFKPAELIYEAGSTETGYDDLTPVRGIGYYYYLVVKGTDGLESSRYYTQSYDPAYLKRPQGSKMDQIRIVPNPYILSSSSQRLRFPGDPDKLSFFNIPGQCRIRIYTESGELIKTIHHTDGSGDDYWKATTSSNQVVASGIYIAHIEVTEDIINQATSTRLFKKGESKILKFVIIR